MEHPQSPRADGHHQNDFPPWRPITCKDKFGLLRLIFADPTVSGTAKAVAFILVARVNPKDGRCDPAVETIADDIARKPRVVTAALTDLVRANWVRRRIRRTSTQYILAFHRLPPDTEAGLPSPSRSPSGGPQDSAAQEVAAPRNFAEHAAQPFAPKKEKGKEKNQKGKSSDGLEEDEFGWLDEGVA